VRGQRAADLARSGPGEPAARATQSGLDRGPVVRVATAPVADRVKVNGPFQPAGDIIVSCAGYEQQPTPRTGRRMRSPRKARPVPAEQVLRQHHLARIKRSGAVTLTLPASISYGNQRGDQPDAQRRG